MLRLLVGFLIAAILAGPVYAEEEHSIWRLFVADHAAPQVSVIDLPGGKPAGTFTLAGPATLYATPSEGAVFAVQTAAGKISGIVTGIEVDDHGDHGDLKVAAPRLLDVTVEGQQPIHFVEHDGEIAVFFDGEGTARIYDEAALQTGDAAAREYPTAAPHHGVAATYDGHILISAPNLADPDALPVGIDVLDQDGKVVASYACPDLHGEATSGHTLAIACATGILFVTEGPSGPSIEHLAYASSLPEGKTTTLLGGIGLQYWLGNYGADRVVLIDPSETEAFRLVDLPTRRVHFAVDPLRPKFAYVFTEDGKLHQLNIISGALSKSLSVTEPYSMDGEWSLPRPRIAVAGDVVAVTDPLHGVIHLVDVETFEKSGEIAVGGAPYNIVAVGGSGHAHD
jgi:hypothetical protein